MPQLYKDKIDWILPKVKGKKVLDLGCVRHELTEIDKSDWLHGLIRDNAASVLGVDYLENAIKVMQEKGYNVTCANVETMSLDDRFELIVAGDLIEHLSNFGMFLERVGEHLLPGGEFLLTTPNPVNFLRFSHVLFAGKAGANPEHTCWFTNQVLVQLARRYSFEVAETAYIDDSAQYYNKLKWKPFLWINTLVCKFRPEAAETIGMVLRKS